MQRGDKVTLCQVVREDSDAVPFEQRPWEHEGESWGDVCKRSFPAARARRRPGKGRDGSCLARPRLVRGPGTEPLSKRERSVAGLGWRGSSPRVS